MNAVYLRLKEKYDAIGIQISTLSVERQKIRGLMEDACTHENKEVIESDPFLVGIGVESSETRYKCVDCYRYFDEDEVG